MTVSSEVAKSGPYEGDGSTTSFAYQFQINSADDLQVIITDAAGVETVLASDYSVDSATVGNPNGGSVTYPITGNPITPLPAGKFITLRRNMPLTQGTHFTNFYPSTLEARLDALTLAVQQIQEQVDRAVKIPASDSTGTDTKLPAATNRALQALMFGADGTVTAGSPTNAVLSSFWQTITAAAGLQASLDALGMGPATFSSDFLRMALNGLILAGSSSDGTEAYIAVNAYYADDIPTPEWHYSTAAPALMIEFVSGAMSVNVAASGTADAVISWTTPLTISNDGTVSTGGNLRLTGNLGVGNAAAATTPGSVVKKIQVFDHTGNSLGYLPVYDGIA